MNNIFEKYFDGSITDEELGVLRGWLDENPENRREFVAMYRIWNLSEFDAHREGEGVDLDKELGVFRENAGKTKNKSRSRRVYAVIFSAAACFILSVLAINSNWFESSSSEDIMSYVNGESNAGFEELSVPYGGRSSLTLPDGTSLRVSAGTRLVYPVKFGKKSREIFVDGQIYLDVAKDAGRPFTVKTRDMDIKVLGTKFIVTAYGDRPVDDIVLVEGSVSVSNNQTGNTTILAPDKMYIYDETTGSEKTKDADTALSLSWMDGKYKFDREPLASVLKHLAAWYGVDVDCRPEAGEYLCSGTLSLDEGFETVLGRLANVVPILYNREEEIYKIELLKQTLNF